MNEHSSPASSASVRKPRSLRDKVAVWLSLACAVHCLATPLLLVALPALGSRLTADPWVEFSILAFVLVLGGSSIRHAYVHHGSRVAPALFAVAFFGLCVAPFMPEWSGAWVVHAVLAVSLATSLLWNHIVPRPTPRESPEAVKGAK